jgi:hypothetical protein
MTNTPASGADKATNELLPCPFCGRQNKIYDFKDGAGNTLFSVNCGTLNCPARSSFAMGSAADVATAWNRRAALVAGAPVQSRPVDMVLHCPSCGLQHIDAPDDRTTGWVNPPHRSHLCHGCGHIWRPADVPTNGVAAIATKGKADHPLQVSGATSDEQQVWLPTAKNVNALPEGVRSYVHQLAARCDPAGDVAQNVFLRDQCDGLQIMYRKAADALTDVRGCFEAAQVEGLAEALAETTDERLKDLVQRRLNYAYEYACGFLSAPAGAVVARTDLIDQYENMRRSLIVQIDELIDIAERHSWRKDDDEELKRTEGAIDYARRVAAPYRYNGNGPPPQAPDQTTGEKK